MTLNNQSGILASNQVAELQRVKNEIGCTETNYFELGRVLLSAAQNKAPDLYPILLGMNWYDIGSYASTQKKSAM